VSDRFDLHSAVSTWHQTNQSRKKNRITHANHIRHIPHRWGTGLFQSVHRHSEIHARFADREGDGDCRKTGAPDLGAGSPGAGNLLLRPVREVSLSARTIANSGQRARLAD